MRLAIKSAGLTVLCKMIFVSTRSDFSFLPFVYGNGLTTSGWLDTFCGMNTVYDSDDCRVFAKALDHAWEIFLKAGKLTPLNVDIAKASLAYAIFHAAAGGLRNPRRLAMAAVARISQFEAQVTEQRVWCVPPSSDVAASSPSA
jgi:hypothetical protein